MMYQSLKAVKLISVLFLAVLIAACGGGSSTGGDGSPTGSSSPGNDQPVLDDEMPAGGAPPEVFLGNPLSPQGFPIYVDGTSGDDDTGDGSLELPYASLLQAFRQAADLSPPIEIYVTAKANNAPYVESFVINTRPIRRMAVPAGTSLYGGYNADWTRTPGTRTRLQGPGTALNYADLTQDVVLAGFDIVGDDSVGISGSLPEASGVAVSGDAKLTVYDCRIEAGDSTLSSSHGLWARDLRELHISHSTIISGQAGHGTDGLTPTASGKNGANGEDGSDLDSGALEQQWELGGAGGRLSGVPRAHQGGSGGRGGVARGECGLLNCAGEWGKDGDAGGAGSGGAGGAGGFSTGFIVDDDWQIAEKRGAQNGVNGENGSAGQSGSGGRGVGIVEGRLPRYQTVDGLDGLPGNPGFGGGGGGGARSIANRLDRETKQGTGGGGGGSGGAGGIGGKGGIGGSASIGLFLDNADIVLVEYSIIQSRQGGNGGNGGTGSRGGNGGKGGISHLLIGHLQGGIGGDGGNGGSGGSGGGGAGGPSVAVMTTSHTVTTLTNNVIVTGTGGSGGRSGNNGSAETALLGEGGYSVGIYAQDLSAIPQQSDNQFRLGNGGTAANPALMGMSVESNF